MWILKFLLIGTLLLIAYEDFRYRLVRLIYFLGCAAILFVLRISRTDFVSYLFDVSVNLIYIACLVGGCAIFLLLKNQNIKDLKGYLGDGDLILWVCFSFWFMPFQMIVFCTLSFIASLVLHAGLVISFKTYRDKKSIPLAGMQSIFFIPILVYF